MVTSIPTTGPRRRYSSSYAAATTEAQRASLASAADALIAATNAVCWAGILTAAAILVLSTLMRRSDFGQLVAVVGIMTGTVGILAEALRPVGGGAYLVYGLLLPAWFALVGWSCTGSDAQWPGDRPRSGVIDRRCRGLSTGSVPSR